MSRIRNNDHIFTDQLFKVELIRQLRAIGETILKTEAYALLRWPRAQEAGDTLAYHS